MSRDQFFALVADVRPELHRFCARMTGSLSDGEDIVQDTLLRAYDAMSELAEPPPLRPWLFRIARNRAIDHMRSYDHRMREPIEHGLDVVAEDDPRQALARDEALRAAIAWFIELPPAQRCCVILKDVLGHSVDEIAELTALSIAAVKAALHRGRVRLEEVQRRALAEPTPERTSSPMFARYAALFNARDWDGVRAMLGEDVRLDVLERIQRTGKPAVGQYFTNYERHTGWRVAPAWLAGREVLAVFQDDGGHPPYFIELEVRGDQILSIRDFRYIPYIASEARFERAPGGELPRG
jgi:RNA polymerase sigma-70 factor (ECF subfamily)